MVTNKVIKRIRRYKYDQPRDGDCILCGNDFATCKHSRAEVLNVIDALRIKEATEKYLQ